jgi:hypothetical protein
MIFSIDFFSSPDPNGQVSYCHHLASGIRRPSVNFKKKSSPLKPLGQFKPNLV